MPDLSSRGVITFCLPKSRQQQFHLKRFLEPLPLCSPADLTGFQGERGAVTSHNCSLGSAASFSELLTTEQLCQFRSHPAP